MRKTPHRVSSRLEHLIYDTPAPLVVTLGLLVALTLFRGMWVPVSLLFLEALAFCRLRVRWRDLRHRLSHVIAFAGVLAVTRPFFHQGPDGVMGGALEGLILFLRITAGVGLLTILGALLDPMRLAMSLGRWRLGRWGMPPLLVEVFLMTLRYIPVLHEEAQRMMNAGRVRMGFVGWGSSLKTMGAVAGAVLWRALDRSDSVWRAMVARGYSRDGIRNGVRDGVA